jgi:hypothetical protein
MMLAGGLAGTATWLTVYPLDIVKSRVQIDVTGILLCLSIIAPRTNILSHF